MFLFVKQNLFDKLLRISYDSVMPTDILRNPPVELLPKLIAAAMAEEPTRECASCGGVCNYYASGCECGEDMMCERCSHALDQFDRYPLREAVGSMLWNWEVPQLAALGDVREYIDFLMDHSHNEGAHANMEPRHLAALWEVCAGLIADAKEGK